MVRISRLVLLSFALCFVSAEGGRAQVSVDLESLLAPEQSQEAVKQPAPVVQKIQAEQKIPLVQKNIPQQPAPRRVAPVQEESGKPAPVVQKVTTMPQKPVIEQPVVEKPKTLPPVAMPLGGGLESMLEEAGVLKKPAPPAPKKTPKKTITKPSLPEQRTPVVPQRPVMVASPEQLANAPLAPNEIYSTLRVRAGQEYQQKKGLVQYQQKQRLQQVFEKPTIMSPVAMQPAAPLAEGLVETAPKPFISPKPPQKPTNQSYKSPPRNTKSTPEQVPVVRAAPVSSVAVAPIKRLKELNVATIYFAPRSTALTLDDQRILTQVVAAYTNEGGGTVRVIGVGNDMSDKELIAQQASLVSGTLTQAGINKNFIKTESRIKKPAALFNPAEIPTSSTHLFNRVEIRFE
jgi:hypothetical protein